MVLDFDIGIDIAPAPILITVKGKYCFVTLVDLDLVPSAVWQVVNNILCLLYSVLYLAFCIAGGRHLHHLLLLHSMAGVDLSQLMRSNHDIVLQA